MMNKELIYRQEALDAIEEMAKMRVADCNHNYFMGFQDAAEAVELVPAANLYDTEESIFDAIFKEVFPGVNDNNADDFISRQAAINVIEAISNLDEKAKGGIVMNLLFLPSGQPSVIRCRDCDWWTKQEDSLQGRCALLQSYPTGGWFCGNAKRRGKDDQRRSNREN